MSEIEAVVVAPGQPGSLAIGRVAAPVPAPTEALVEVEAFSLNLGEVRRAQGEPGGARIGWDLAGRVVAAAQSGVGPKVGTRVVGLIERGAWSRIAAVPTSQLAALPDGVTMAQAATLPVAGLTALYALERRGSLIGRRVLVTGASGGVGHFACQIARHAGAHVVALVRRPTLADLATAAGAHTVVAGEDAAVAAAHGPYDSIVDGVGGAVLGQALGLLAKDGLCVAYGVSAGSAVTFDARNFFRAGRASLYGLYLFHEFFDWPAWQGLSRLSGLVAAGVVKPHITHEADWREVGGVAQQLLDRKITGKAVQHVR